MPHMYIPIHVVHTVTHCELHWQAHMRCHTPRPTAGEVGKGCDTFLMRVLEQELG